MSIPFSSNVVNHGEDGWSTIFNSFTNNSSSTLKVFKETAEEIQKLFDSGSRLPYSWSKWAQSMKLTDKHLLKFLSDVDSGTRKVEDIGSYMESLTSTTSKLASSLKSAAANLGIMLAVSMALKAISTAWDKANTTFEEQQKIVENLKSEITSLKEEEEKLLALRNEDGLTEAEQSRLDYLRQRLELDEKIYEKEQKQLHKSKLFGDGDFLSGGELGNDFLNAFIGGNDKVFDLSLKTSEALTNAKDSLQDYAAAMKNLSDAQERASKLDPSISKPAEKDIKKYKNEADKATQSLEDYKGTLLDLEKQYLDKSDSIKEALDAGAFDDSPNRKAEVERYYQAFQNAVAMIEAEIVNINAKVNAVDNYRKSLEETIEVEQNSPNNINACQSAFDEFILHIIKDINCIKINALLVFKIIIIVVSL